MAPKRQSNYEDDTRAEMRSVELFAKKSFGTGKAKSQSTSFGNIDKITIFDASVIKATSAVLHSELSNRSTENHMGSVIHFKSLEGEENCEINANEAAMVIARGKKALDLPLSDDKSIKTAARVAAAGLGHLKVEVATNRVAAVARSFDGWRKKEETCSLLLRKGGKPLPGSIAFMLEKELESAKDDICKATAKGNAAILEAQISAVREAINAHLKETAVRSTSNIDEHLLAFKATKWAYQFVSKDDPFEEESRREGNLPKYDEPSKILFPQNPEKRFNLTIEEIKAGFVNCPVLGLLKPVFEDASNLESFYGINPTEETIKKIDKSTRIVCAFRSPWDNQARDLKHGEPTAKGQFAIIQEWMHTVNAIETEVFSENLGPTLDWFKALVAPEKATELVALIKSLRGRDAKAEDKAAIRSKIWEEVRPVKAELIRRLKTGRKGFTTSTLTETGTVSLYENLCTRYRKTPITGVNDQLKAGVLALVALPAVVPLAAIPWSTDMKSADALTLKNAKLLLDVPPEKVLTATFNPRSVRDSASKAEITTSIDEAYMRQVALAEDAGKPAPPEFVKQRMWAKVYTLTSKRQYEWFALCLSHGQVSFKKSTIKSKYKIIDMDEIDWDSVPV